MKCSQVQKMISVSFDAELSEAYGSIVETHLAECRECQSFMDDLSLCTSALNALSVANVRPGFTNRVIACIPEAKTYRVGWRERLVRANPIRVGFSAMGLACGIAVAVLSVGTIDTSTVGSKASEPKETVYSEAFVAMPMESVGGRYLALAQRGGE